MVKRVLGQARQVNIACSVFVLLWLFVALPSISKAQNETLEGLVIGITDGDTATLLLADRKQEKVRLSEIDAPEFSQPYGNKSRQELASLIFKKNVYVEVLTHDRYRRPVARIFMNDLDVNAEMVKRGAAWFSVKYGKDSLIKDLEVEAKKKKRGLWALPEKERIPPWEWRHPAKPIALAIPMQVNGVTFKCESKKTCREMSSCDEAKFYLHYCSITGLDGNHDGIPCTRLCR